jgi:hypothetical protein
MNKALSIIKKYPPPMIYLPIKHKFQQIKIKITQPKIIKQTNPKDIIFCPIWVRKFF